MTDTLDSCIFYDGERHTTVRGEMPFQIDGLHWQTATTRVRRVWGTEGLQAIGVADNEEVARGFVTDVRGDNEVAILHVAPPKEHEH